MSDLYERTEFRSCTMLEIGDVIVLNHHDGDDYGGRIGTVTSTRWNGDGEYVVKGVLGAFEDALQTNLLGREWERGPYPQDGEDVALLLFSSDRHRAAPNERRRHDDQPGDMLQ